MNIVIPMAGKGSRFVEAGYKEPKPFIDVLGIPMIERVMKNMSCQNANYILIARQEHLDAQKEVVERLMNQYPITFLTLDRTTEGAACTVLAARKWINNDEPLIIANSDQIVDIEVRDFINDCFDRQLDGSILTFIDNSLDTKWSYAKLGADGLVTEVKEKVPISNIATVGIYLFARGKDYVDSAIDMIVNNDRYNNEFYTCPVYNYAITNNLNIGVYNIDYAQMHGIGIPDDLTDYIQILKQRQGE